MRELARIGHGQAEVEDLLHLEASHGERAGQLLNGDTVEIDEIFEPGKGYFHSGVSNIKVISEQGSGIRVFRFCEGFIIWPSFPNLQICASFMFPTLAAF